MSLNTNIRKDIKYMSESVQSRRKFRRVITNLPHAIPGAWTSLWRDGASWGRHHEVERPRSSWKPTAEGPAFSATDNSPTQPSSTIAYTRLLTHAGNRVILKKQIIFIFRRIHVSRPFMILELLSLNSLK